MELALDLADRLEEESFGGSDDALALVDDLEKLASTLDGDRQFSSALAELGRVVVGMVCAAGRKGIDMGQGAPPNPLDIADEPDRPWLQCDKLATSIAPLAMAAYSQAGLMVRADEDGMVRRYPYIFRSKEKLYPSLALAATLASMPEERQSFLKQLKGMNSTLPLLPMPPAEDFRLLRFSDIMDASPDSPGLKEGIQGKILVVGVSAQGTEDMVRTPVHGPIPGVFVHASAIVGLLAKAHIRNQGAHMVWAAMGGLLLLVLLF